MKKLLIAAGFVLAMTGLANAQTTPAKPQEKVKTEKSSTPKAGTGKHGHHGKKHKAAKPEPAKQ